MTESSWHLRLLPIKTAFRAESDDIDLGGITERTIPYYDSRDKQKAQLSATVNVVYNGELVPFYNRDDLDVEDAYYSLIDSNDDKVYDTVVISRYTPVLVARE